MAEQFRVTDDGLRLRERPDVLAPTLGEYPAGTIVTPLTDHAWRQVRTPDGRQGWMAAEYLSETEQAAIPPRHIAENGPKLHYDPNTPTYLQRQDWTCSIGSVIWMLRSLGIEVDPGDAQDAMSPRYVNSDVGLLDASGAGIVEVLRDRWGVGAYNDSQATFDSVAAVAGRQPVALGLRTWGEPGIGLGHWSAVRGFDGERLILANPAGTGPRFGQQTLSREEFNARGPASAVVIPLGA